MDLAPLGIQRQYLPPGAQLVVANYLSQLDSREASNRMEENFLDDHLFRIVAAKPTNNSTKKEAKWLIDINPHS